jgi:hypothetical protein
MIILLLVIHLMPLVGGMKVAHAAPGDEDNPIVITNATQLAAIGADASSLSKHYILGCSTASHFSIPRRQ